MSSRQQVIRAIAAGILLVGWTGHGLGVPRAIPDAHLRQGEVSPAGMTGDWVEQTVPPGAGFRVVHAVDENIVWAGGDGGRVVLTVDGGASWYNRPTGFADLAVHALYAFDDSTALVDIDTNSPPYGGTILRTTDGGMNWAPVDTAGSFINGFHFFNNQDGWLLGDPVGGFFNLQQSTDGGLTWNPSPSPPAAPPGASGLSRSYDWAGDVGLFGCQGGDCFTIFRSGDRGDSWTPVTTNLSAPEVALSDNCVGLAGENSLPGGALERSTDCGQSWYSVAAPLVQTINSLDFGDGTDEVWGHGVDFVPTIAFHWIHSIDGGLTWTVTPTGDYIPIALDSTCGSDSTVCWSVGALFAPPFGGRIFKTVGLPWPCPTTSVEMDAVPVSARLALRPNRPNPFNPSTLLEFDVSDAGRMSLRIYDGQGRLVRRLQDGHVQAGTHAVRWDGRDEAGKAVASGVYMTRLDFDGETLGQKIVLTR